MTNPQIVLIYLHTNTDSIKSDLIDLYCRDRTIVIKLH